jgi:hypothetical protein
MFHKFKNDKFIAPSFRAGSTIPFYSLAKSSNFYFEFEKIWIVPLMRFELYIPALKDGVKNGL